jgi:L-fucose isomerase-like protein
MPEPFRRFVPVYPTRRREARNMARAHTPGKPLQCPGAWRGEGAPAPRVRRWLDVQGAAPEHAAMNPRPSPTPQAPRRFPLFAAVSTIHDASVLRGLLESYLEPLRALGGEVGEPPAGRTMPAPVVFVATGGTERQILEGAEFDAHEPALLIAHPGHNSLPAAMEVLARVQQLGIRGQVHYLRGPADTDGLQRLAEALHHRWVRRALIASRIGLVGGPSDWLVASSPTPETVRTVWGPTVVPLPLETILSEPDAGITARGEALARDFRTGAAALEEPAESDLLPAGRVHAMLHAVVQAERLDAVAVRCFDLVVRKQTTGCLALAHLNDQGIIAGCEGDLVATVAMLWIHRLLGTVSWMANPSRIDLDRGRLSVAHCTVPRSVSGAYRLRSHFESGLGVGIQGTIPTGPVTLVRIGAARMERLRVLEGDLRCNTDHPDLCRTQVEIELGRVPLEDLLAQPLGNHLVVVAGHHAAALRRWHEANIA